jgi:phosphonate transport system substrate-binding protein
VAVPAAFNGALGFHAVLVARANGAISSVEEAQGHRLAVAGEDSVSGRMVPFALLEKDGIVATDHFAAIVDTAGPYAAISALLTGAADVAVGWTSLTGDPASGYDFGVLTDMVRDGALAMDQVRVIWQSPLIPFGPHAVRNDIPPEIRRQVEGALRAMAANDPAALDSVDRSSVGGGGFVPITADDYGVIAELIGASGPDGQP